MPYNLPAPSTLEDVFKMNPGAFSQAQQFMQGGVQQNEQDLQASQLKNMFDRENNPLMLENQRGINRTRDAQLPGVMADSRNKQLTTERAEAGQADAISLARKEFLSKASDADLTVLKNEGQKMAYSHDPQVRARGELILAQHADMIKERMKQSHELSKIRETGNQARLTQQQGLDGGRWAKSGRGGAGSIQDQINSGKLSYEKAATMLAGSAAMMDIEASGMEDGPQKEALMRQAELYRQMADDFNKKFLAGKTAAAGAGAETKPYMPALGVPTNPPKPVEGFQKPGATASKIPPQLPQGTKVLPDGTFKLPDGRIVRQKTQ
jgi:hypothetical protein